MGLPEMVILIVNLIINTVSGGLDMANMNEYLCWRGDLGFDVSPLNEVDGLILSYLSYVPWDQIVTSVWEEDRIPLHAAVRRFWEENRERDYVDSVSLVKMAPFTARRMADTRRFQNIKLCYYTSSVNIQEACQFGALCVETEPYTCVIFRGTDNSLIGWKENLQMSYRIVPAQEKALKYLSYVGEKTSGRLIVIGHSKGGNLAAYAAAMTKREIQDRIDAVYNYDGPGFMKDFLRSEGYQRILDRYHKLVPSDSVFGMMLGNDDHYTVIDSNGKGMQQHDPLCWRILGSSFCKLSARTDQSLATEDGVRMCVDSLTAEERERVIDLFFSTFREEEMRSLDEVKRLFQNKRARRSWMHMHKNIRRDPDVRKLVHGANQAFLTEFGRMFFS